MASGPTFTIEDKSFPIDVGVAGRYVMMGPTEKGPFGQYVDVDNVTQFKRIFGNRIPESDFPAYAMANLDRGCKLRVVRVAHATDPDDISTLTPTFAEVSVNDNAPAATPARFVSTAFAPAQGGWVIDDGETFTLDIDGSPEPTKTVSVTAAQTNSVNTESNPWDMTGGKTLQIKVNRGQTQNVDLPASAFAVPATATPEEVIAVLNGPGGIDGAEASIQGVGPNRTIRIEPERKGTTSYIEVIGGDANTEFAFPTSETQGAGDFANHQAVSPTELKTFLTGPNHIPAGAATYEIQLEGSDKIAIETVATGSGVHVGFDAPSSGAPIIGGTEGPGGDVPGTDAGTPQPTIKGKGSSEGPWAAGLDFVVALEGTDRFSITIPKNTPHVEREEFYGDLSMDNSDARYFLNIINGASPSMLFEDLGSTNPAPDNRPAAGTHTLAGGFNGLTGLDGNDFIGGPNSKLGINALNAAMETMDILWPTIFEDLSITEGVTAIQNGQTWTEARKIRILYFPPPNPTDSADTINFRNGTGAYTHPKWDSRNLVCYYNTGEVNLNGGGKKFLNALAQLATVLSFNDTGNNRTVENVGINFAPAGNKRAQTSFLRLGQDISFPDPIRDTLENAQLNYIADMGKGRVLWNQSNLQVARSKLQDLNIVRMVYWLAEKSQINLLDITFDPLDPIFWRDAVRRVEKLTKKLVADRGLFEYAIFGDQDKDSINDVTVNTPAGIDAGEYRMEVYLKPTPAAKIINVELIITESSVDIV